MTSKSEPTEENKAEILVAWQKYKASRPEELTLIEGETVELLDTEDPSRSSKRIKLDPELDNLASTGKLLDSSAAKHKLSVKPRRRHASSRYSPTRSHLDTRWLVRQVQGDKKQGWVPCYVLQSVDEPIPGTGLPGDAAFRRQAVVKELVETEQEFVKDLDYVVQEYLIRTEGAKVPKIIKDNLELVFGGLVEIADFHRTVLMEGVKYYANEPNLLGKAFLRLERDFDKHVNYCTDEPLAQTFLESCDVAKDYYDELSQRLGDDKTLSEHLKLPIQRINDYQLLLKELVRYSECLGEDCANLQKALELMLSVPHRAQDDKFTSSIEGYRGSIHKLGRLVTHDWFSVTFGNTTKERYLFLFKARILISKVRRISEDRSVFQLKDIIRLPQVEIKDHPDNRTFELVDKVAGHSLLLAAHRDHVKELWLKEIREFASDVDEHTEDIQLLSEATSTLTSEAVPSDVKPFAPPQVSEAQKLLAAALKAGVQERKLKATEAPKVEVIEPAEEPKAKAPKLAETQPKSSEPNKPVEAPKPPQESKPLTAPKPPQEVKPAETPKPEEKPKPTETPKSAAQVETQAPFQKPKPAEAVKPTEALIPQPIEKAVTETPKPVEAPKLEKPKSQELKPKPGQKTTSIKEQKTEKDQKPTEATEKPTETPKPVETVIKPKSPELPQAVLEQNTKATSQPVDVPKPVPTVASEPHQSEVSASAHHNKVQVSAAEAKAESVSVAIKLSVEVDGDMSRRYSGLSSSGKGEDYDSSFSRRSVKKSSYGADGLSSSRSLSGKYGGESLTSKYGSDSISSKYGAESSLSGKYGTESSISNKYSAESSLSGKYGTESSLTGKYGTESSLSGKYGTESSLTGKYGTESSLSGKYGTESLTSKYGEYGSKYGDVGDTSSSSYARRSATHTGDADALGGKYGGESTLSSSYTSRKILSDSGNGDGGLTSSSYTRKYHHESGDADDGLTSSYTRKYGADSGDGESSYSYSRKTASSLEGGDLTGGSKYSSRRMVTSASELGDLGGTKYTRKTVTSYGGDDDDDTREALLGKYSTKGGKESTYEKHESVRRSVSEHGADDDVLSKFSKYERRVSETTKKAIPEDIDEDARIEAEMRRKYAPDANKDSAFSSEFHSSESSKLRSNDSAEKSTSETREFRKSESVEKHISESREFRSSESAEKRSSETRKFRTQESIEEERLSELRKFEAKKASEFEERTFSGKGSESESKKFSGNESESESKKFSGKESESESKKFSAHESSETKSEKISADEEFKKSESGYSRYESTSSKSAAESTIVNGKTTGESVDISGSVATTFKIRRDSSVASVPVDGKPNFLKKLFGVNIEPGESAEFEVELSAPPDNVTWLKDNKPLSQSKRIKTTKTEEGRVYRLEIKEGETLDAGLYSAIATNSSGKSTCSAQLIVHELTEEERSERWINDKPVFLVQLKDTELLEDTYLRFMVKVKGDPTPHVIFYKDDIKIRESNIRCHVVKEAAEKGFYQLVIPEVKQEDAGLYKCVAFNKFGQVSSEATVTVTDSKDLFQDLPPEPLLEPGEKPVFVWKKDGIAFEPEERFKVLLGDDEDSLALIFQHVRPEDAGLYTCVAQTSSGHISCSAELTVQGVLHQLLREPEKPKLEIEKKEAIAAVGSSAMLELQVKGYPKPQVKWTHEGKPIEPGGKYKFLYEDEESMSLVIKNVQAEDAGSYIAEARNELGSDTAEMTLTVKAAPKIKTKLQDISEAADLTIRIPVEVEGIPKPSVQFYKDGQEIKKSERIKVVEEGDKHILVIEKSEIKDSGSYSIVATNEISQVSKFWSMDIHSKPKIIKKMDSKTVSEKENVTLSVQVESKPEPEVKWYKDGEEVSSEQYLIKKDGDLYMLKISGAVSTDASRYTFKANNIYGSVETDCQVYVKAPPRITKPLKDMTVNEHEKNVELDVKMEAYPKPTVKWYLDEMEITESRTEFTRIESDDGSKLVIREVTSDLSGQYKCKVINELGETETSAKLTVNCKPRVIKHLKDTTVDEGATLHLEVEVEACPEPTVKWLRNGREVSADARIKITRDTHRKENYHLAVDLIKYEEQGEYEVIVTNSLGTVNSKSTVTVQKVTHSDAIEEDEPPKKHKLKVEVVENEPEPQKPEEKEPDKKDKLQKSKSAEKVEKVEIEELDEEEPVKPKETEIEKPKSAQGISSEKYDIEIDEQKLKSPEPIIEEPLSPEESYLPKRLQKETAEVIPTDETSTKSQPIVEDDVPQKRSTRGKSVQFEEAEIVEITEEVKTPVQEEAPKRKLSRGLSAQKEDAEIIDYNKDEHEPKTPVEEDVPKKKLGRGLSAQKEDAEVIDYNKDDHEPKTPVEEDLPKRKLSRGVSAKKEDAEVMDYNEDDHKPKTPVEDEVPKRKLSRGLSAQTEDAEVIEYDKSKAEPKTPVEEEAPKKKLGRGLSAQKEEAEVIENKDDQRKPKSTIEEDAPKKKLERAISSQKEEVEIVENEIGKSPRRTSQPTIDRQESQKGVKTGEDDDDELEALLRRAQKQRSLVEDITKGSEKTTEAAPKIIDSDMKDKTQYESLDLCYVVKASATPQPTAVWTVDGKPLKADSHVQISDNGEEFKLEIKKLDLKDAGVYECKLSNAMGDVKKQATLSVLPEGDLRKPKIKKGLENKTIMKNKPAKLTAVITGEPAPEVTWCINGKEITPDQYEKYKIILDAEDQDIEDGLKECTCSLTIPKSEQANSGKYTIKAKNKWGEAESSAQLTIVLRPEIEGPEDVSVVPGNGAEFTVIIKASPEPDVTWYKDGKLLETGHGLEIVEDAANEMYKIIIRNVQLADEGRYKVTAKNEIGEESSDAKLRTVKEAGPSTEKPKFITGLSEAEVQDGGEISLMVRADGLPTPEIRWFLNGKPLQEDDNHKIVTKSDTQVTSTLAITDYNKDDIGQYKAMAVNIVGEAETTAQISMIKAAPSFGNRLERTEDVNEGEPLELKAKILGSPKPTLQWYKDGEPVPADDDRIKTTLLPDGTVKLNIEKVTPGDSGAYKLVVKNPHGETSSLCAVAVNPKPTRPKFLKSIKDAKVTEGEPLRLEAQVSGYPPPEIKWLKDGVPIRPSSNIHLEEHPDGTVALVVDAVKPENAGTYTLQAVNKLGEGESDAKVEIDKKPCKPEFITKMQPLTVVEGFPAKFEVKAKGFPAPTITWTRNNIEIIPDNKHVKITDLPDGTSILLIDGCDIARDPMPYKAIASNQAGDAETSAELAVTPSTKEGAPEEPPVLLHSLRDVVADEGQPLVMEVPFTANPMPSVEWFKDGEPLEPSDRILQTCDGKKVGLHIDNATPADAGKYSVKLSNPLGSDDSEGKAAIHKVFSPPRFTQRFTDLQQVPDRDAKFSGKVSGVPTPEVTWYKDGSALSPSDKYRIKRDGDLCSLYISDCKPSDAGVYRAFAVNKEGSDTCEAKLDIVDKVHTPLKVEPPSFLKRIGDLDLYKGMTAKFTACATGFPEPTVEWFRNDQKLFPSDRIKMEVDRAGLLRLTISGISEDDLGKYSCKISNEHGSDICHANLQFDELDAKPRRSIGDEYVDYDKHKKSGIPVPLSDAPIVSQMTDRHCTLSWRPSIASYPRAPVTYQLEMCEMPHGDWFTARSGIRNCVCTVGNLEPFRDYRFRVRVENKYGISDPSPYATTYRQKLEPDPPRYRPYLPAGIPFHPDSSPYFPKDFDIDRPPHGNMDQAPRFLRQEHPTQYGVKDQNTNLFWYVYGYPKPKMQYYFNDEPIESGGRFDMSYTRNGQATLFINKMLDRDVGWYEAVATNEHGQARQRVRLEIAEIPEFIRRPEIEYSMLRGKVRFEARILGKPYPEVKWYKDWKPLADSSRIKIRYLEPDLWIFTIDDVILRDAGLYSVSARNVAGTVSSSAMLYVDENDFDYNLHTYGPISPIRTRRKLFEDYYDLGDELGRGTQGITYHAVERGDGYNYGAKVMHGRGDMRPFMYNELDMMNHLRHRRLISLHDAYETDDRMILVMELGGGGELVRDYLLRRDYYTESDIAFYIRQLLEGVHYMHDSGYGHMGLNIGDLLLSHPGGDDLKITDFGLTRRIIPGSLYPLLYGVPEYASPEAVLGEGTGFGQDMWSIGIITHILLSGRSPFLGRDDRETLTRIRDGSWAFDMDWWGNISLEARDFISSLLVYSVDGRMDIYSALRHPWLERAGRTFTDEYRISSSYLSDYFLLYRDWYDNASCRKWYRRRPLEGAFTHPSRMVYPPGEFYTPPASPAPKAYLSSTPRSWEDQLPSRSPLNYEIGLIKSESHYQNGPDTYLLQLRDVNFPVRVREYMKVAANRGPGRSLIISNENGFDWDSPTVRERRRFTDVMDEEIDDERKARINRYGADNVASYNIRRLRREIGARLDTYAEAEAMIEMKQEGRLPFFREKPQITAMVEGQDFDLTCYVVGDPQPVVQWFKNDAIVVESARVKIDTDLEGRSHFKLRPALGFDLGMYRVVARNKVGQTTAWTRIVFGQVPDSPDSPEAKHISDTEILLIWKPPKCDGNSAVVCYSLQYKLADDSDWIKKADNIDHEFYLMSDLEPDARYMFRLAANNAIGWSEQGVPTAAISTLTAGSPKIQLSTAMKHLQQITDSGQEVEAEIRFRPDYNLETEPVDWSEGTAEEHYEFISEISRGKYSAVLKGIDKSTDKLIVAKLVDLSTETAENLDGEFAALRSLRHERVAGLLAAYRTSDVATFILEKLQGADVLTYLASKHEYTEQTVSTIVTQVLDGLQYLHWRNLCHLDIQPDNVVMCGLRSVQVKLVDFGNAHRVTKLGTKVPVLGHPDYISPEVLNEEPAFPQTDIWSLGVLTYVMLSGMLPFRGDDDNESRQNVSFVRYRFEYLFQELSQEGNRFIMQIFKRNPNKRPTAEECHENRWLLPTDSMIKKRERAIFLGSRLKEYSEKYHNERTSSAKLCKVGKSLVKSHSVQEELLIAS